MHFIIEDNFVFCFLSLLSIISIAYSIFSRSKFSPIVGILLISYGMFAYSIVPLFASDQEKLYWFLNRPPPSVSRITLLALFMICTVVIWRARERVSRIEPGRLLLLGAILIVPFLATVFFQVVLQQLSTEHGQLQLKFAFLLSFFLFVAASSAIIYSDPVACQRNLDSVLVGMILLLGAVTIVAFLEVAYEVAPVANMMRGNVELRASSAFQNPNWFAFAATPSIFIACKLSERGRLLGATVLFGICTLAFILSGSRSATTLAAAAMVVLAFALWRTGSIGTRVLVAMGRVGVLGSAGGVLAGLFVSLGFGGRVPALYFALLDRMFLWPVHLFVGDKQAWLSIEGRITTGSDSLGVVDSAYIYLLQENAPAGVLLILLMVFVLIRAGWIYSQSRTFDDALRLSVATFVVSGGVAGQVYWAFPVWPVLALMLGYAAQPLGWNKIKSADSHVA
jgi:hypothetical protein